MMVKSPLLSQEVLNIDVDVDVDSLDIRNSPPFAGDSITVPALECQCFCA